MQKHKVRTPADALDYITDCTLATVCGMAMKTRRPKHELERQMAIAQTGITWMVEMGVVATSRAKDVIEAGSVEKWASKYIPNA